MGSDRQAVRCAFASSRIRLCGRLSNALDRPYNEAFTEASSKCDRDYDRKVGRIQITDKVKRLIRMQKYKGHEGCHGADPRSHQDREGTNLLPGDLASYVIAQNALA